MADNAAVHDSNVGILWLFFNKPGSLQMRWGKMAIKKRAAKQKVDHQVNLVHSS